MNGTMCALLGIAAFAFAPMAQADEDGRDTSAESAATAATRAGSSSARDPSSS